MLLHVVDASDPLRDERIEQVREVLRGIGAGEIRELLVFNKIDLFEARQARSLRGSRRRRWHAGAGVGLGGTGAGLAGFARSDRAGGAAQSGAAHAASAMPAAAVRSDLYRRNAVRAERQCDDGSWEIEVELDLTEIAKLLGAEGVDLVDIGGARREQRVA